MSHAMNEPPITPNANPIAWYSVGHLARIVTSRVSIHRDYDSTRAELGPALP
jgi:hypothetical protein